MASLRRILLPVDFTPLAAHAGELAHLLATRFDAELHVIHVVLSPVLPAPMLPMVAIPEVAMDGRSVEELVERASASLRTLVSTAFAGLAVTQAVLVGSPHLEICAYARRLGCDVIVIGTHAPGVVRRVLLGSVSKLVLEHAPCAVLMVPPPVSDAP